MDVYFDDIKIENNSTIDLSKVQSKPTIKIKIPTGYYTLIMVDPDAPSIGNPIYKHWLHWLIINSNDEVVPFEPSSPPPNSGPHRYFIYLFEQSHILEKSIIHSRKNFPLKKFISDHKLKLVGSIMYKTSNTNQ